MDERHDKLKGGFSTRSVHGGESRRKPSHSITNPIVQTATYVFSDTDELIDFVTGKTDREEYGRYGNPTKTVAERKLAELEGGEDAALFSSGMNAFTSVLLAMLSSGAHVIIMDECYRRSRQFCLQALPRYGIDVSLVKTGDYEALEAAITDRTRIIVSESPTNPYLNVIDLERIAVLGRTHGVKTLIDGTFATPFNQRPLEFGIDLVVHSATKYLGGHNDLLAGVVIGNAGLVAAIREFRDVTGGIVDPHGAYLLIRGLKTFALRMEQHNRNGLAIASFLEAHPRIRRVYYPGLASHPHHEIARRQMTGFGGVVSFEIDGDMQTASRFIDRLRIPFIGPSLGGVESLIEQPAIMSFYEMEPEDRLAIGIKDELVRFSVGIENVDDLIDDLDQALKGIS
ncbi:MAG: aminotransferase class I/II-fold pyridoxal phosphate-dependent enzyme [candidate division Zixibacteria bacterium]|nr:aminotransferase class I/II-fold pyridoxal phosphate-dependent enzyme [candidate division Zixibacteria bacterium]